MKPFRLKKPLLVGIGAALMIIGAASIFIAAFYQFKVKPEMAQRGQLPPAAAQISSKPSAAQEQPGGIGIDALMNYSKNLYGSDEKNRREGTLWVDREGKKLVVNLGALNGLKPQDRLTVYDHDQNIGRVQAANVFDVISYVEIKEPLNEAMEKDYYIVRKE